VSEGGAGAGPRPQVGRGPAAGLIFSVALVACTATDSLDSAATTVTQSGDTTIILPALDGPTGRLASDLVIGADESNPDAVFGRVADAAFGPDGKIYVVDPQATRVPVFARDGSFERSLTRDGDGPGEVQRPEMISVGPDGSAAVVSLWEVEVFGPDGEPRATMARTEVRPPARLDSAGVLRVHHGPATPPRMAVWRIGGNGLQRLEIVRGSDTTHYVLAVRPDGSVADSLPGPFALTELPCLQVPEQPTSRLCLFVAFAGTPWFDWLPDGRRIEGRTDEYRIDVSRRSGPSTTSIRVSRPRVPIPAGAAAMIESSWIGSGAAAEFAPLFETGTTKPPIAQVLPGRDGRIWVRLHAPSEASFDAEGDERWAERESRFDIFTPEGEHVGYVTGPPDIDVRDARGDTLLTTRTGPFDIPIVERFIIDWSDPN
jgi:hypothetical protein